MNFKLTVKLLGSVLLIIFISIGIAFTKIDLPFSISFLIPIIYFSVQKEANIKILLLLSLFASTAWFVTSVSLSEHKIYLVLIFNGILRFGIYFSVSYLLMQLKKQSLELKQKNNELLEINQEKNIMLGTAAHDIRNAASAIYSFSNILLENLELKTNLEKEIRISSIINKASGNLLNLVTNILDLSKIESGQIHLHKISTDYTSFISDRIDLFKIIAQNKNIRITFENSADVKNLTFDPVYLTEVIDNLLSNAIKYSKPGCDIKVKVKILNNYVYTEVIDSGIGIRNSELELLFKPFSKTSSTPTEGEPSAGIGLAIARKVVKLHGGEIGVESVINEGSKFYFVLPI